MVGVPMCSGSLVGGEAVATGIELNKPARTVQIRRTVGRTLDLRSDLTGFPRLVVDGGPTIGLTRDHVEGRSKIAPN
jgi:hypothetical protein